jgi:tripartite-type tricarboxylate transporter receptor subunit TctC
MKSSRMLAVGFAAVVTIATASAFAADVANWPQRPIRVIMPNAPGSSNDTLARIIAVRLGEALGQQMVIDNRPGAGGLVGMEIGKGAAPDGYTLVGASTAAMSIAPHIHKNLPYDPIKDYEYISMFGVTPNVLVINPGLPVKSVKEFVDFAKSKGNTLNMASAGAGAQSHLTGAALMVAAGFQSTHVPYKGGGAMDDHAGSRGNVARALRPLARARPQPAGTHVAAARSAFRRRNRQRLQVQRLERLARAQGDAQSGRR